MYLYSQIAFLKLNAINLNTVNYNVFCTIQPTILHTHDNTIIYYYMGNSIALVHYVHMHKNITENLDFLGQLVYTIQV